MLEKELIKKELEIQLEAVKQRQHILNLIEERLIKMRKLAGKIGEEDLTDKETYKINKDFKNLQQQIKLLNSENTQLS